MWFQEKKTKTGMDNLVAGFLEIQSNCLACRREPAAGQHLHPEVIHET